MIRLLNTSIHFSMIAIICSLVIVKQFENNKGRSRKFANLASIQPKNLLKQSCFLGSGDGRMIAGRGKCRRRSCLDRKESR